MLRVLTPVDDSEISLHAIAYLIRNVPLYKKPLHIHLLNVRHPFPGTIQGMPKEAEKVHHEEGIKALTAARKALDDAGLQYTYHIGVGDPAEIIARYVKEKEIDQVVMTTRGRGSIAKMLLGSVAAEVLNLVSVPVLLVK